MRKQLMFESMSVDAAESASNENCSTTGLGNLLIRASAGTGKTYQLSNRYLGLLKHGVPVERILATTFTRKAAGEIFDRVVERIVEASRNGEKREQLIRDLGLDSAQLTPQDCQALLTQLTKQLHRTRIVTLDAFFAELARSFSLQVRLPAGWQIADESFEALIRQRAIERMLVQNGVPTTLQLLRLLPKGDRNRQVAMLLENTVGNLFEIYRDAKPSGERAWHWLDSDDNVPQESVDQALVQLTEFASQSSTRLAKGLRSIHDAAVNDNWEAVADTKISENVLDNNLEYYRKPLDPRIVDAVRVLNRRCRFAIRGRVSDQLIACERLLKSYEANYREICDELKLAAFSDIPDALGGLESRDEALAFRLDARLDHLLFDEFQDTSAGQWLLLRGLAKRVSDSDRGSLFCVGDRKQAIYAFRRGTSDILDAIDQRYTNFSKVDLKESRRSRTAVISMVNEINSHLDNHSDWPDHAATIEDWTAKFPHHEAHWKDTPGYARLHLSEPCDFTEATQASFDATAALVEQMWQASKSFNIAVLVRRNDAVPKVMRRLRNRGIRASEEGGNPLTDSAPVRVILSLLRFVDCPKRSPALFHVATSPLASHLGLSLGENRAPQGQWEMAQEVRRDLAHLGFGETISNYANALMPHCSPTQARRLLQLVDLAFVFDRRPSIRTRDFVRLVEAKHMADPTASNVIVMTVHQAKGLEFDRVIVTELDRQLRPDDFGYSRDPESFAPDRICPTLSKRLLKFLPNEAQRIASESQARLFREELCILYVALTRAKYELQVVIGNYRLNDSKLPKSMAGLVRAALGSGQNAPRFEAGQANWLETLSTTAARPAESANAASDHQPATTDETPLASIEFADQTTNSRPQDVQPSTVQVGGWVAAAELFSSSRSSAMKTGTLLHAWFEQVTWIDRGAALPSDHDLRRVAAQFGVEANDEQIKRFRESVERPAVRKMFDSEAYGRDARQWYGKISADCRFEVINEYEFSCVVDKERISGAIDRLVLTWNGGDLIAADIIDFKTDVLADAKAARERAEKYAGQMAAYRKALASTLLLCDEAIRSRLLFTELGHVVDISG